MNFVEHHLGDYLKQAGHLSLLEHGVYGRLRDVYFASESPIPDAKAERLVAARSAEECAAVRAVLEEFFELHADRWHRAEFDIAIASYKQGDPEREAKKTNEALRLQRHRDERARLFKLLNAAGGHADWNIKIDALRALVAALPATPATQSDERESAGVLSKSEDGQAEMAASASESEDKSIATPNETATATPATLQATATATPATATHYPLPTPQVEIPSEAKASGAKAPHVDHREETRCAKDTVFALGLALLTAAGVKENNARSFLALQCKGGRDAEVAAALEACAIEKPVQPIPWLQTRLNPRAGAGKRSSGLASPAYALSDYAQDVTQ